MSNHDPIGDDDHSDRAAAILAELAESPEVAALVAADIGSLRIAGPWEPGPTMTRWSIARGEIPIAEIVPWWSAWQVEDRPRLGGPCTSVEDGMAQADAELRRRGWRLL